MFSPTMTLQALLALTTSTLAQIYNTYPSITAQTGTANTTDPAVLGNYYNYWRLTNNGTVYDLTRSDRLPVTNPKLIPTLGFRPAALIEPSRTAFITIDMQNFFLHPSLSPAASLGRAAVGPTVNLINAFKAEGMKTLWVNWGIDDYDLVTMPPSFLEGFSTNSQMNTTFCTEMGELTEANGTVVDIGKKLCRGSWNAQPWGALYPAMVEGLADGSALYFNKSMFHC